LEDLQSDRDKDVRNQSMLSRITYESTNLVIKSFYLRLKFDFLIKIKSITYSIGQQLLTDAGIASRRTGDTL
jgi:hypothetical protein